MSSAAHNNNFLNDQIASLREAKPNLMTLNRTLSAPLTNNLPPRTTTNQLVESARPMLDKNDTSCNHNSLSSRPRQSTIVIGDYVLYNLELDNDVFGNALNTKLNQFFYWKKFDRCDYMSRMESYFILAGSSERIFNFKEILFDDSGSLVYVIFNQFYDDLHSYMKRKKRLDETEAKHLFRQCVQAVDDCHQNGIIVRDIKLKKFVFTDAALTRIALINPEDCLILEDNAPTDMIKSQQGCPAYISPEVLNTNHSEYSGKLSDSWSLGIVLYTLLLGRYPFHHQAIATMFAKIARAKYIIPPSSGLSFDAKILLRSLIRLKPSERLLPSEILNHNWLKSTDTNLNQLQQNKFKNLSSAYTYLNQLSNTMSPMMASSSSQQYVRKPLRISRSTPAGSLTSHAPISNDININNNNSIMNNKIHWPASATKTQMTRNNSDKSESDDCVVPVFIEAAESNG